jgi:protein-tyrosine phosphatase
VIDMEITLVETLVDPRRLVSLEAVHNFRDLGGYPARNGLVTRWNMLYRADGLNRLVGADVDVVRELGLRTVIDLRSHAELDQRGTFPVDEIEVDFNHLPVFDTTWQHDAHLDKTDHEFLAWAYRDMLVVGGDRFAAAIEQLATPGALPAVFHCAAGKDRTGMLAALILGSLGVPREVLLADYGLTAGGMVRMRAWAEREMPEFAQRMADAPSAFLAALPDALGDVLDEMVRDHGSVHGYVLSLGVAPAAIEALAAEFLVRP